MRRFSLLLITLLMLAQASALALLIEDEGPRATAAPPLIIWENAPGEGGGALLPPVPTAPPLVFVTPPPLLLPNGTQAPSQAPAAPTPSPDLGGFEIVSPPLRVDTEHRTYLDGVLVTTFDELYDAVVNSTSEKIYLGYTEANGGVIRYAAGGIPVRRSIEIIGVDYALYGTPQRMALQDYASSATGDTLRAEADNLSITFRNLLFTGYNYYGMAYGGDTGRRNISITTDGVTYAGRQAFHNEGNGATVTVINSNFTIASMSTGNGHEFAETNSVTFYGTNTILRTAPISDSTFWLHGGGGDRFIRVTAGASLRVETTDYLIYEDGGRASLYVDGDLEVITHGPRGALTYDAQYLAALNVTGRLLYTHNSNAFPSVSARQIDVSGQMQVDRPAGTQPVLRIQNGGAVNLTSPSWFRISNTAGPLMTARNSAEAFTLAISGQVINQGVGADGRPTVVLTQGALQPFSASWRVTGQGATAQLTSTLPGSGLGESLKPGALDMRSGALLAVGTTSLTMDPVYRGSVTVTGARPSAGTDGTDVLAVGEYTAAEPPALVQTAASITSAQGRYTATLNAPPDPSGRVYAIHYDGRLEAHLFRVPQMPPLAFLDVPQTMLFAPAQIAPVDQRIGLQDATWHLTVSDQRGTGFRFTVMATMPQPMQTADGQILPGALVFVPAPGAAAQRLGEGAVQIAQVDAQTGVDTYTIASPAGAGFFIDLPAYQGVPDTPYQAQIVWTLMDGG